MSIYVDKTVEVDVEVEVEIEDLCRGVAFEVVDYWFESVEEIEELLQHIKDANEENFRAAIKSVWLTTGTFDE